MGDVIAMPGAVDITEDRDLGRACRILWIDSGTHRDRGWAPKEEFIGADTIPSMTAETVGLWLGETDEVVVVAQTRDIENDKWLAAQVIYKPCILKVEWLP